MGAGTPSIGIGTGRLLGRQIEQLLVKGTVTRAIPNRIFVDNEDGTRGFTINFTGVSQTDRERFLRLWRARSNVDNSQRSYDSAYRRAIASDMTSQEATQVAQLARTQVTRNAMQRIINNNSTFAGVKLNNRVGGNR